MKKYSDEILEKLKEVHSTTNSFGIEVKIKKSPLGKGEGYLDSYEKVLIEKESERPEFDENLSLDTIVSMIREGMGFPNLNLNTQEIITKYEEINFEGNSVEMWRYYKRKGKQKDRPCLIYFHGGAWIGGTPYITENSCKLIAEHSEGVIFNIGYSLAPEKPFPNGFNDCYNSVKYIYENADFYGINKDRISVAGDSAGGNCAAAVCLKARDEHLSMIKNQFLIYPATARADVSVPGYEWSEEKFVVAEEEKELIKPLLGLGKPEKFENDFINGVYCKPEEIRNPYVSPMVAKNYKNLPEAYIYLAEFDGLRHQGEFYASQLSNDGVKANVYRYQGVSHAFFDKLGYLPQSEDLCLEIAKVLKNS